jgi:riboflavin kinase/FMN adenylyltransferase
MSHLPPSLVAIGNFDGVHRGHRAVLGGALSKAMAASLVPRVLTFSPHPAEALGVGAPATLTRLPNKIRLLNEVGFDVEVQPFDRAFAAQSPETFARVLLRERLDARIVVVGQNFRFGHRRAGDLDTLRALGDQLGFEVCPHQLEGDERGPWSSTRVRRSLEIGHLDEVLTVLGRNHVLEGVVMHGQHRARGFGFPTANLSEIVEAIPAKGVYAVRVERVIAPAPGGEGQRTFEQLGGGVANIGTRPTLEAGFAVEAHVFDLDRDLYGETLRVELVARLRDEKKFGSLDELKEQISRDAVKARELLSSH